MQRAPHDAPDVEVEPELGHVAQLIRTTRATPELLERWLHATWRDPVRFRRALYLTAASRESGAIKSRPELGVDLYTDCISSHLGHGRAALVVVQDGRRVEITYEALHARCSALASAWIRAGVKVGDTLALLLPVGVEYCVALMTGLRLGLVLTPVPPLGATYARQRVLLAATDHVVTQERWHHMLPPDLPPPLAAVARSGDATYATSHAYAPGDVALRLLSAFGPQDALAELAALPLHEGLLRDGLLVLALEPSQRLAAPGRDVLQMQPLALLCTWLAGATWVECSLADVAAQPGLLSACGVDVLGVEPHLRELIREQGAESCRGVRSWYRSLSDRFDHDKWRTFSEMLAEREIPSFSLLYNAASGGAHLFSPRSLRDHVGRIWPAPGRSFIVSQVGASNLPALNATGVYTPLRDEEADASLVRMVIAKLDHGWSLGGSIDQGPDARSLPLAEIAACARRHPSVGEASVLVLPGRWPNEAHVLLLAFVPDPELLEGPLASEVLQLIARELGERHVPERVELFALHPRCDEQGARSDWCSSQYLSGLLGRKARMPLFLTLSRLSWIFASHPNPS